MPLKVETIGDMIDGGYGLAACCEGRGCNHRADLDLEALARRLGRDHGCMHNDLAPYLRCTVCDSRKVGLRMSPYKKSSGYSATSWMAPPKAR